jgi:hypothetical protein
MNIQKIVEDLTKQLDTVLPKEDSNEKLFDALHGAFPEARLQSGGLNMNYGPYRVYIFIHKQLCGTPYHTSYEVLARDMTKFAGPIVARSYTKMF